MSSGRNKTTYCVLHLFIASDKRLQNDLCMDTPSKPFLTPTFIAHSTQVTPLMISWALTCEFLKTSWLSSSPSSNCISAPESTCRFSSVFSLGLFSFNAVLLVDPLAPRTYSLVSMLIHADLTSMLASLAHSQISQLQTHFYTDYTSTTELVITITYLVSKRMARATSQSHRP